MQATANRLDAIFFALSDATRRSILERLAAGEAGVNDLKEAFSISQPAISRHLKVLERAKLIRRSREAQRRPARIDADAVAEAAKWIEHYQQIWEANYQRLDALLAGELKKRKRM
ncbi:MAG TPA: metalloregulator ArsR/SmtB family transcription factor [Candidatus Tumulicola sp.]|jgi:DNA-binding transcriptional ArsR family regulator